MSSEALAWAMKQAVRPSGAKFTLVAMCECANYKTGRITPSLAHLVEITGQNRKTIIAHIAMLETQGFIADTGERTGKTKQIKVYAAHMGTVPKAEPSLKRNSPKNDVKQSQKRDTEPSWEPSPLDIANAISPPKPQKLSANDDQPLTPQEIVEDWNSLATSCGLPIVRKLTPARVKTVRQRLRQYPDVEDWRRAFAHIRGSPFLLGENKTGWRADFDFLLQAKSFTKLTEEAYGTA